jgi:hypothetical protein
MDPKKSQGSLYSGDGRVIDAKAFEKAADIARQLANTVSSLKLFPSDHATVGRFVDTLADKMKSYLDQHGKLEIGINEFSFTFAGRILYTDEAMIKSLPFFFFKDGLQILYFYKSLDRAEIANFLDIIRKESQKPAGDGDIVTALWKEDFANIQYYAPDDYLESRIAAERGGGEFSFGRTSLPAELEHEIIEIKVDTSKFTAGKIELTAADREAIRNHEEGPETVVLKKMPTLTTAAAAEEFSESGRSPAASMDPMLSGAEIGELEDLIRANRTIAPDEEFLNLMVEILYLEKDIGHFSTTLELLLEYYFDLVRRGGFGVAILFIEQIGEIRNHFVLSDPEIAGRLDGFLKKTIGAKTLEAARQLVGSGEPVAWEGLTGLLRLLGSPALPLAADIYESVGDPDDRRKILDVIVAVTAGDAALLAGLAGDERPLLSKDIIGLLKNEAGKKALSHFTEFLRFRNKEIKLSAIEALGDFKDELANRVLMGFLEDADEDIRIQAALRLNPVEEQSRIRRLIRETRSKAFQSKSAKEIEVILSYLGRTKTPEAAAFLKKTLLKRSLWPSAHYLSMRLGSVAGLETMGTEEAKKALESGTGKGKKAVREACARALARLSAGPAADPGEKTA